MTDTEIQVSDLAETGDHTVVFQIRGLADLPAGLYAGINDGVMFQPDSVQMEFCWFVRPTGRRNRRGWHVRHVQVSGYRRLRSGQLGKERKRVAYRSAWETEAPPELVQLIRAYMPSYPVGVALGGNPPALLGLAELEAHRRA